MITDKIFVGNPDAQRYVQDYYKSLANHWKRLVKTYYNRREDYWGRIGNNNYSRSVVLYPSKRTLRQRGGNPRLADALTISWQPETGRVKIRPHTIMVRGGNSDLVTILSVGSGRRTPKAYKVELDIRVPGGERGAHDITVWTKFMNEFVVFAEMELEFLADKLTNIVADAVIKEFDIPEEF
jgi:hypothetical protein